LTIDPVTYPFGQFTFLGCATLDPQVEATTGHFECLVDIENKPEPSPPQNPIPHYDPQADTASSNDSDSILSDGDILFMDWMERVHQGDQEPFPFIPPFAVHPDEVTDPGVENFGLEYVWRPPYGDPEDWYGDEYIGTQKYLPDFTPVTIADVAIYNTLWPQDMIQYLGQDVPPLDVCDFDNLWRHSDELEEHFIAAETEYPTEFMGRRTVQYYIDWYNLHNDVDEVEEAADMDEDSCATDEPEAKCPKVVPGCN
jgi:hypothetical protein